jgi:hypothetical protein
MSADITALRESYREARGEIKNFTDQFELDIGLAAVRLEAAYAYRELVTTASGTSDADLAPLKEYVANLTGGEGTVAAVETFDRKAREGAKQVFEELMSLLTTSALTGVGAAVVSFVTFVALAIQSAGTFIFGLVIAGGSAVMVVLRSGQVVAELSQRAWLKSWTWATALGVPTDRVLQPVRQKQTEVLRRAGIAGPAPRRITDDVRSRATLVLGVVWGFVVLAGVLLVIGFYEGFTDWWASSPYNTDPYNPDRTFTTP